MAIKGRQTLYSIFVNGAIPSEQDFRDLIDSALNRKDDHFFGEWSKGTKYCEGDVVVYDKSLYKLIVPLKDLNCPVSPTDIASGNCYCSVIDPPDDPNNWCSLELDLKDKDWEIVFDPDCEGDCSPTIVYQLDANVGIGTHAPQAQLDVSDLNKVLVKPNLAGDPTVELVKVDPENSNNNKYTRYKIGSEVSWETDLQSFVFKFALADQSGASLEYVPDTLLMKITANADNTPQVGIGTANPKGGLHVFEPLRGEIIANPGKQNEPSVLIANLEADSNGYYSLAGVSNKSNFFSTNSPNGFRFKKDNRELKEVLQDNTADSGDNLVAIMGDGRVGVGTENPKSSVEFTDGDSASIRFELGNVDVSNPAISINSLSPGDQQPDAYLTMGVDDVYGTFVTDAPSGFVFKKGGKFGTNKNEVDINQGDAMFFISPEGKIGVGTKNVPADYDLDVNGQVCTLTQHLVTDADNTIKIDNLSADNNNPDTDSILEKIGKLRPCRFEWKKTTGLKEEGPQIGLAAQNVYEVFPELVKKTGSRKAIAYSNLSAVLVQAIQDQQQLIEELTGRVQQLEAQQNPNVEG